jgi:hypothetical protein
VTPDADARFVRYQTTMLHPRRPGVRLGIFAAVNTLARRGQLDAEQERFRAETNRWFDANMPLPTDTDPTLYSDERPLVAAWFKLTSEPQLARVPGYLAILDAHGIEWTELRATDPGPILYEDPYQVVVTGFRT